MKYTVESFPKQKTNVPELLMDIGLSLNLIKNDEVLSHWT